MLSKDPRFHRALAALPPRIPRADWRQGGEREMEGSAAPNGASGEQEDTAADVGAPVATSVGSVFDGATPGSGAGRTVQPVQPGNRWVIYYDKNGVELQRKPKGPGK
ncbi:MAG: hypothetical protein ACPIOQ_53335, partial [Promethearchaeia archaeon]